MNDCLLPLHYQASMLLGNAILAAESIFKNIPQLLTPMKATMVRNAMSIIMT